jgi:hypothetical protein
LSELGTLIFFEQSAPLLPLQQLLAVLPTASISLLPISYHKLILDSDSPLTEFYPSVQSISSDNEFSFADWDVLLLVPMINIDILKEETTKVNNFLNEKELQLNKLTYNSLYRSYSHEDFVNSTIFINRTDTDKKLKESILSTFSVNNLKNSNFFSSHDLYNRCFPGYSLNTPSPSSNYSSVSNCNVLEQPSFPHSHKPFPIYDVKTYLKEKNIFGINNMSDELICLLKFLDEHNKGNNVDLFRSGNSGVYDFIYPWVENNCSLFPIDLSKSLKTSKLSPQTSKFSIYSPIISPKTLKTPLSSASNISQNLHKINQSPLSIIC